MRLVVVPLLLAGLAAALLEVLWVLVAGHALFLSSFERGVFAVVPLTAISMLVFAAGLALSPALAARPWARWVRVAYALFATVGAGWAGWLLTEGRRVKELSLRPALVLLLSLAAGAAAFYALGVGARVRASEAQRARILWSSACGALVALCLALDALVLPRSYPAFHAALSVIALFVAGAGGAVWRATSREPRASLSAAALCVLLGSLSPWSVARLAAQPNASFVVLERAPWAGKLLRAYASGRSGPQSAPSPTDVTEQATSAHVAAGIDLRDEDVLLITVDALRADALSVYGGKGRMPELDALAKESVVFKRAYTPAPHTSYALTSLLTAKFMKPVVELPGAPRDHATLPDLVRRYGYRTAAFYPPAIFFVDGARFEVLRERGFGFEYQKKMYASGQTRVEQLKQYLAQAEKGHPLFVWVHLFEPHEPYEPPAELVQEDSARGRYLGEVALVDRAIGALVREFRRARPEATVIVTSDHGEEFGEHGGHYHGTTLYDEQVRIPLVWSSPGKVTPGVRDTPVELVDVGTTLLSALGIPRDARMRGDDLGAVLRDETAEGPRYAFASVEDRHMVTDGKLKVLCAAHDPHCQLFDLEADPRETKNLALDRTQDLSRLRSALEGFLSSIAKVEALAMSEGVGFPEALARARLGAPGAGPDVVPLLGDSRETVRAAAARALGELEVRAALPMLTRVREHDASADVRAEAHIAALLLGDDAVADAVVPLLAESDAPEQGLSRARRAALALARLRRLEALPVLSALALDDTAQEVDRVRAVAALGTLGTNHAVDTLKKLLPDVRLRVDVAAALGEAGGRRAADALAKVLENERYQPARKALAEALYKLQDRRTRGLVERFLGMETGIPGGMRILLALKALDTPSAKGARVVHESVRSGPWRCRDELCSPGEGAELVLPQARGKGPFRVTFLVDKAEPGAALVVDGERIPLAAGESQPSVLRASAAEAARFVLRAEGELGLVAVAVTKAESEIPPPPPEPWQPASDAGTPSAPPSTN